MKRWNFAQIDALLRRLGKTPEFIDGLCVTDADTMDLVEMMLGDHIDPALVGLINQQRWRASATPQASPARSSPAS